MTAALAEESAAGAVTLPALAKTITGIWLPSVLLPVFYFQILLKLA